MIWLMLKRNLFRKFIFFKKFESCSWRGVLDTSLSVSALRQVGGFLRFSPVFSTNKTDCHDITEILLKVALNTINQATQNMKFTNHKTSAINKFINTYQY
jgi:hypothetical protein